VSHYVLALIQMRGTSNADKLHDLLQNQTHVKLAPPG